MTTVECQYTTCEYNVNGKCTKDSILLHVSLLLVGATMASCMDNTAVKLLSEVE